MKHIGHDCKVCGKNLTNSMELLQHVAIEHDEEDVILNSIISMDNDKADTDIDGRKKTLRIHMLKKTKNLYSQSPCWMNFYHKKVDS